MSALLTRLICWRHGHTMELATDPDRLALRCVSCGHTTPGWTLDRPPPVVRWRKLLRFKKRMRA